MKAARAAAALGRRAAHLLRRARKRAARRIERIARVVRRPTTRVARRIGHARKDAATTVGRLVPMSAARVLFALGSMTRVYRYVVPGERHTCPACGASGVEALDVLSFRGRVGDRYVGFVSGCPSCGLVFANPLPTREELDAFYSPDGAWGRPRQDGLADAGPAPPAQYFVDVFRPVQSMLDISTPPPGSTVLDIGCGAGELLDVFAAFGWTTYGIEPAERRAFPRHREMGAIPETESFDLAILHHVLEHVDTPLALLQAVARGLRPGGFVFVSVPRLDALAVHRDYRYCINSRAHITAYTRDCMATLLARAGFEPVDVNPPVDMSSADRRAIRRLRMIGRKTTAPPPAAPPPAAAAPLEAARRAINAFMRSEPDFRWRRVMPVRAAAAAANLERARGKASRNATLY